MKRNDLITILLVALMVVFALSCKDAANTQQRKFSEMALKGR